MAVLETIASIGLSIGSLFGGKKGVDLGKQYAEDYQANKTNWEKQFNEIVSSSNISDERKTAVIEAWNTQVVPKLQQNPYIFDHGPVEGRYPRGNVDLVQFTNELIASTAEMEPVVKESLSANSSLVSTLAQNELLTQIQAIGNKVDSINPEIKKTSINPMLIVGAVVAVVAVIYFIRKGK